MVVQIIPTSDRCGVTTHALSLVRLLVRNGFEVAVISLKPGWMGTALRSEGVACYEIAGGRHVVVFLRACCALLRLASQRRAAVHAHGRICILAAALMAPWKRTPLVATVHQFNAGAGTWRQRLLEGLEAAALNRAREVWCVSDGLRRSTAARLRGATEGKVVLVRNWIDAAAAAPPLHAGPARGPAGRICAFGRLAAVKGFDLLVRAVAEIRKTHPDIVCDIYGDGPERLALQELIAALNLRAHVHLKDAVAGVIQVMGAYDVLAMPSRSESFGLVILEAYAAGVAVVAPAIEGVEETVVKGVTAMTFEAGNVHSLAGELTRVLDSKEQRESLARSGRMLLDRFVLDAGKEKALIERYRAVMAG